MSLRSERYDKAKKKAAQRLEKWVNAAREDRANGISRLISSYPGILRRIEFEKAQSTIYHIPEYHQEENLARDGVLHVAQTKQNNENKLKSVSVENVATPPPSEQRKTLSEGSVCEIRVDSQKSRFSRRSSRLSVEDPFRFSLWSSRGLHSEPCCSKLSDYGVVNECLEVSGTDPDHKRPSTGVIAPPSKNKQRLSLSISKKGLKTPSQTHIDEDEDIRELPFKSPQTTTKHRRSSFSGRSGRRRSSILPLELTPAEDEENPPIRYMDIAPRLLKFFRKVYNIVLLFKCTSRELSSEFNEKEKVFEVVEDGQVLTFDPLDYLAAKKTGSKLPRRAKRALEKRPGHRHNEDIASLLEVIDRVPVLAGHSKSAKEALADRVLYDRVKTGRVVIKQGQKGSNMYYVVSGTLQCRLSEVDPRTGEEFITYLPDLKESTTFGELALVRDIKRTATVKCKTDCELLMLSRDDFNSVLRETWEKERRIRLHFLQQSPYFRSWTEEQLELAADITRTRDYSNNDVILGDISGVSPVVYFIMSGTCRIIKQVSLARLKSPFQPSLYQLPHATDRTSFLKKNYGVANRLHQTQVHNLTVTELADGDFMGVGEDLRDIHIIAKENVRCLTINSAQFEINAKKQELAEMALRRQEILPNNYSLHRRLLTNMRWSKYKKKVVKEVVSRKKISNRATILDVPLSIRLEPRV